MRFRRLPSPREEDGSAESVTWNRFRLSMLQSASPDVISEDGTLIIALQQAGWHPPGPRPFHTIRVSCSVLEKASAAFDDMIKSSSPGEDGLRYVVCDFENRDAAHYMFAALHGVSYGGPTAKTIMNIVQYSIAYEVRDALAPWLTGWCEAQLERLSPGPWRDDHTLMLLAAQHCRNTPLLFKLVELANLKPEGSVIKELDVESPAIYKDTIVILSEMFSTHIGSAASFIDERNSPENHHKSFSTNYFSCPQCERQGTDRVCAECGQDMPSEHAVCTLQSREADCERMSQSIGIVTLSGSASIFLADQIVKAFSEFSERVEHECSGGDACPLRLHFAALPERLDAIAKASEKQLEVELSKRGSETNSLETIFCRIE